MISGDGRLVRAIKCHDCKTPTKNVDGFCQHHKRNSLRAKHHTLLPIGTVVNRPRAIDATDLAGLDAQWVADSVEVFARFKGRRSQVVLEPDGGLRVTHVGTSLETAEALTLLDESGVNYTIDTGPTADVILRPSERSDHGATLRTALDLSDASWARVCESTGMLHDFMESYDDWAEVVAQMSLTRPPAARVSFGMRPEGGMRVRITRGQHTDAHDMLRIYAPDEDASVERTWTYDDTDVIDSDRVLLDETADVLTVAARYSVQNQRAIYLPVGWIEA